MIIKNKTFIISGGASGLGAATAKMIAEQGGNLVLLDLNEEKGKGIAQSIGDTCRFIRTDVTDEASVQAAIDLALSAFGAVHGAVNCAGIGPAERVLGRKGIHRLETFSKVIQVNLVGTFNVLRLAANAMQHNEAGEHGERGVIINTASIAAYDGQIGQAGYAASKGGIVSMTLPIARELARFGIRIMTIAPGIFETAMLAGLPEDVKDSLGQQVPFPARLGNPAEFANLVKQIVENQMLNGTVIRIDGAIRMASK
jgi:NAD(P)-dependent dehydrogenase (short-subunit alcohol dehydrogenase family)